MDVGGMRDVYVLAPRIVGSTLQGEDEALS